MKRFLTAVMLIAAPAAFAEGGSDQEKKLKEQAVFEKSGEAFDLEGTVKKVEKDEITLTRQDFPDVKLEIEDQTKIEVAGRQITPDQLKDQLQEGDQVRARFQLEGDDPIAVELKSEKK